MKIVLRDRYSSPKSFLKSSLSSFFFVKLKREATSLLYAFAVCLWHAMRTVKKLIFTTHLGLL